MNIDSTMTFSDDQAETTQAAHDSTNIVDFGVANPNAGAGMTTKWVNIIVTEAVASAGAATVAIAAQDSPDNSTWTTLWTTAAIGKATLVKGKTYCLALGPALARYMKLVYTVAAANLTAGKFSAWIGLAPIYDVT